VSAGTAKPDAAGCYYPFDLPLMLKKVYLETSFFSFLCDDRPAPAIVARREWTEEWWSLHRSKYDLITGASVLVELARGELSHRQRAFALALSIPSVPITKKSTEIVTVDLEHRLMPRDPVADASHLALASVHRCDFLLTWNCRNLANANKFGHIRRVNVLLGLHVPVLVTPLELMEGSADEAD
jgi:hypothetical protein